MDYDIRKELVMSAAALCALPLFAKIELAAPFSSSSRHGDGAHLFALYAEAAKNDSVKI